jgi:hypothetical protein
MRIETRSLAASARAEMRGAGSGPSSWVVALWVDCACSRQCELRLSRVEFTEKGFGRARL